MKQVDCPGCGVTMHYGPQHEGQSFRCPKCAGAIVVPRPTPVPPPTPARPAVASWNPFTAAAASAAERGSSFPRPESETREPSAAASGPSPVATEPAARVDSSFRAEPPATSEPEREWTPPRVERRVGYARPSDRPVAFLDFNFDVFITPSLIRVAWAIAVILALMVVGLAVVAAFAPFDPDRDRNPPAGFAFLAVLGVIIYLVGYRIVCEAAIVFFDIRDTLRRMEKRLADASASRE